MVYTVHCAAPTQMHATQTDTCTSAQWWRACFRAVCNEAPLPWKFVPFARTRDPRHQDNIGCNDRRAAPCRFKPMSGLLTGICANDSKPTSPPRRTQRTLHHLVYHPPPSLAPLRLYRIIKPISHRTINRHQRQGPVWRNYFSVTACWTPVVT